MCKRSLIQIYEPDGNFWELNGSFKTLTTFAEFYNGDRSKGKKKSSDVMWIISGVTDEQSPYHDMPDDFTEQGKYKTISNDLQKQQDWWEENIEEYASLHEEYERLFLTPARRALRAYFKKLNERQAAFDSTPYEIGIKDENGKTIGSNVEILDKMFERNGKLWDQYHKIAEAIEGEGTGNSIKGGSLESGADTGRI